MCSFSGHDAVRSTHSSYLCTSKLAVATPGESTYMPKSLQTLQLHSKPHCQLLVLALSCTTMKSILTELYKRLTAGATTTRGYAQASRVNAVLTRYVLSVNSDVRPFIVVGFWRSSGCTISSFCSAVLWPQCFTFVAPDGPLVVPGQHDRQNLAMCKEVDSLLESLQNSWQALHQHSHACSVLGLSTDNGPCTQDTLTSIPMDNLADQHQQQQHGLTHMSNNWPPISCQQQDTHPDSAEQILVPTVSLGSHGDQNLPLQGKACEVSAEQQHTLFNTLVQAAEADSANQSWSAGSMLWGDRGLLLGLQRLWEHLMHDTQVVSL